MQFHGVLHTGCIFYKLKFAQVETTLYFKLISLLDENNSKYRLMYFIQKYEAGEKESEIQLVPGFPTGYIAVLQVAFFLLCFAVFESEIQNGMLFPSRL